MHRSDVTEDLLDLLAGRLSEEEVAARHGVTLAEVRRWRALFVDGLSRGAARRRAPLRAVALVAAVVGTYAVAQSLVTFTPNSPALASEVNANFGALKTWLENKTGPVGGNQLVTDGGVVLAGAAGLSMTAASLSFGTQTRQMVNLSSTGFGLGVQPSTLYQRSGAGFAWFRGGAHSDVAASAGAGGTVTMQLDGAGNLTTAGTIVRSGFQVACAGGESGYHFGFCCRMDVRTGAAECRNGNNTTFSSWGAAIPLFAAAAEGHYSLSCMGHRSSANWPVCCRTSNSGATDCKVSAVGGPLQWTDATAPW